MQKLNGVNTRANHCKQLCSKNLCLSLSVLVPCGPGNFQTSVDCSSGVLQLTWDQTYGANGYSASVIAASTGRQVFCNSTSTNCSLSSLPCGESYTAQVRSYNGTCFSMLSQAVTFKEGQWTFYLSFLYTSLHVLYKGIHAMMIWGNQVLKCCMHEGIHDLLHFSVPKVGLMVCLFLHQCGFSFRKTSK